MFVRRPALLLFTAGLGIAVLAGCSSSSPEVGEMESGAEAEDQLQEADREIKSDSSDTEAYFRKARALRQKADSSMAADRYIELYRRAKEAEDKAIAVRPDVREGVQQVRQKVYNREKRRGERAYNLGAKHDDDELFRQAIGFSGAAAATQPDSATPVLNEAYARLRVGQKTKARSVLEEYMQRADTAALEAYRILGKMYVSSGKPEKAESLLDRGIKQHPEDEALQALRLNAYNQAGDVDEALATYREQIEKTPNRPTYLYNYGALLLKAKRYDRAIEQLEKAVARQGDDAEGQYNLGTAYLNAALVRDDSIAAIEQNPGKVQDTTLSAEERIEQLAETRQDLFEQSIPPLERARQIVEEERVLKKEEHPQVRQDACRALLVAYVQTDRPNRAAEVEDCTGFAQAGP